MNKPRPSVTRQSPQNASDLANQHLTHLYNKPQPEQTKQQIRSCVIAEKPRDAAQVAGTVFTQWPSE